MPESYIDRDNGYAKTVTIPDLVPIKELIQEGKIMQKLVKGRRLGLDDEQILEKTRPDERSAQSFKLKYGISIYEYEEMFFAQGRKCAICRQPEKAGKLLSVDHCHSSKRVRGLLCGNCNLGLGMFKDNTRSLTAAVEYLRNN